MIQGPKAFDSDAGICQAINTDDDLVDYSL